MRDETQDVTEAAMRAAIRARRSATGTTIAELVEKTDVSRFTLNNYFHGDSKLYFGTLLALARALDTTVEGLIRDAMELTRQGVVPVESEQPTVD